MIRIEIDQEAKSFINQKQIKVLTIYVDKIPCGCIRPKEVTKVEVKIPKEISEYEIYHVENIKVFVKKGLKIPSSTIEVKLGTLGKERILYPIGIEYFNGMGNYCELPE